MKTIANVDAKPPHYEDNVPAEVMAEFPTYRQMFRSACSLGLANSGEEAMDLVQIGLKMRVDETDIQLEDAQFRLLKQRCDQNPCKWQSHFHGQVMLKLRESEK